MKVDLLALVRSFVRARKVLLLAASSTTASSVGADENQYNKTLNHKSHISIQLTARAVTAATLATLTISALVDEKPTGLTAFGQQIRNSAHIIVGRKNMRYVSHTIRALKFTQKSTRDDRQKFFFLFCSMIKHKMRKRQTLKSVYERIRTQYAFICIYNL